MSKYDWSEYQIIKAKYDLDSIKSLKNSLKSLLNSDCLNNEFIALKGVSKRLTIRLRSAKVCRLIKHLNKCLDKLFELKVSEVLDENVSPLVIENYDTTSGYILLPFRQQMDSVLNVFVNSIQMIRKVILISLNIFSHCHQWLRSGHLAPHFLMMSSCVSRINIIMKAIMVYINDLYLLLMAVKDVLRDQLNYKIKSSFPDSLESYLTELDIKCIDNVNKMDPKGEDMSEDIGVAIQRSERQMQTNCDKNVKKVKKKSNNKKKSNVKQKTNKEIYLTKISKLKPKQRSKQKKKQNKRKTL